MQVNMYGAADAARKRLAEQTAQQGDQGDANQGNTAASPSSEIIGRCSNPKMEISATRKGKIANRR